MVCSLPAVYAISALVTVIVLVPGAISSHLPDGVTPNASYGGYSVLSPVYAPGLCR